MSRLIFKGEGNNLAELRNAGQELQFAKFNLIELAIRIALQQRMHAICHLVGQGSKVRQNLSWQG